MEVSSGPSPRCRRIPGATTADARTNAPAKVLPRVAPARRTASRSRASAAAAAQIPCTWTSLRPGRASRRRPAPSSPLNRSGRLPRGWASLNRGISPTSTNTRRDSPPSFLDNLISDVPGPLACDCVGRDRRWTVGATIGGPDQDHFLRCVAFRGPKLEPTTGSHARSRGRWIPDPRWGCRLRGELQ